MNLQSFHKTFGPGILFASAAIGTSHLILSTQAGAHYGLIMGWVIALALVFKYPFFEYGARYAAASGKSLLTAYYEQGKWALSIFMIIIFMSMFTVVGAVGAASAGLLGSFLKIQGMSGQVLASLLLGFTLVVLAIGRYSFLDKFIKLVTVTLFVAVLVAFIAVLIKGPATSAPFHSEKNLFDREGMTLIIGLLGWMPVGLEASAFSSIWTVKKIEQSGHHPTLRESLFDFNLGYIITAILAFLFLIIGAFTIYGTGEQLVGSPVVFSNRLVQVFTGHIGPWSFSFVAVAAFGAIYGTLLTAWDAFARSFVRCLAVLRTGSNKKDPAEKNDETFRYIMLLALIGAGAMLIIGFFGHSLVLLLKIATVISFMAAPVIGILNFRAVLRLPQEFRPSLGMIILSYLGIFFMVSFALFYIFSLV